MTGARRRGGRRPLDPVEWLIGGAMVVAVVAVAIFAGVQSYTHIYELALSHHEGKLDARLLPLSIDGLLLAVSLVMLWHARRGLAVPGLARGALWGAVAATIAANVTFGVLANMAGGAVGIIVGSAAAGAPAASFVTTVEVALRLLGPSKQAAAEPSRAGVAADVVEAARLAYIRSAEGGNPLPARRLAERFNLTRGQAGSIVRELGTEAAG